MLRYALLFSLVAMLTPIAPLPQPTPSVHAESDFCSWVAPSDTNPDIDLAAEPHYVCHDETTPTTGQLMVFFPGTGARPSDYQLFVETAATMGHHSIGLSYYNPRSVNLQICPTDPDPNCHANVRSEVLFGGDTHDAVEISNANSATGRSLALLDYLSVAQPNAAWDQFSDGELILWDKLIVAGHSQGGGMAAYIAHREPVARAIMFGWVDLRRGVVAPWLLDDHATPADQVFFFEHVDDRARGQSAKEAMFTAWGVDAFGEVNVDGAAPPYDDARILLTALPPAITGARPSAAAHNMPIADIFTPRTDDGETILLPTWQYLLSN